MSDQPSTRDASNGSNVGKQRHTDCDVLGHGVIPDTDLANGRRLAIAYGGDELRHCPAYGWLHYRDGKWQRDAMIAKLFAKEVARKILDEINSDVHPKVAAMMVRWSKASQSAKNVNACLDLARSEPEIYTRAEEFDADPWLLNCDNCVLDLQLTTGVEDHDPNDLMMRIAGTGIDTNMKDCPLWLAFLDVVLPDPELRAYIRRAVGYSLTGFTKEQCFFFLYGMGANGKTVFLETLLALLGDYAITTPASTIMGKRKDIPNDLARLAGKRVVAVTETSETRTLDESRVKDMTGGDTLSARFLHKEYFDFKPEFKLWLRGNHKPEIRGTDEGIWRRVHLIPFTVEIPPEDRDPDLAEKLLAELPAILMWALDGVHEWRRNGLCAPVSVLDAVQDYRDEMDVLGQFIEEMCDVGNPQYEVKSAELLGAFSKWCDGNGHTAPTAMKFSEDLKARGFHKNRKTAGVRWLGLQLKASDDRWNPER